MRELFDKNKRLVKVAEKGDKPKPKSKEEIEKENAIKAICLNCTKPKCTGWCENFPKNKGKKGKTHNEVRELVER